MKTAIYSLMVLGVLSACGTAPTALDSAKQYRMDLDVEVNGVRTTAGQILINPSQTYNIRVRPKQKPDLVTLISCHREVQLGSQGNDFIVSFSPTEVESTRYCSLDIEAFSMKQWYQGAMIIPAPKDYTLPGTLVCNGWTQAYNGVSACQARAGLIERIKFSVPVNAGVPSRCQQPTTTDGGFTWEFKPASGECAVVFKEKSGARLHLLSILGYDQLLP